MNFDTFAKAGLQEAISQFGTASIYKATTYYGVQSDNGATFDLEAGGFSTDANFSMHYLKDDFEALPIIGDEITIEGKDYRITKLNTSEKDPGFELACEGINK